MTALAEIERAIDQLPEEEFAALRRWFWKKDGDAWDAKIHADSAIGRLNFLFEEATTEDTAGELRDWPSLQAND